MRKLFPVLLAFAGMAVLFSWAAAQPPGNRGTAKDYTSSSIVTKMMAFNTAKDGKLTRSSSPTAGCIGSSIGPTRTRTASSPARN